MQLWAKESNTSTESSTLKNQLLRQQRVDEICHFEGRRGEQAASPGMVMMVTARKEAVPLTMLKTVRRV